MSFLSDLFEGNFDNLGTDISHAPSSLAAHPAEIGELAGGAALIAAPFLLPEIAGALGTGALAEGAIDVGGAALAEEGGTLAADLGIGDIGAAAGAATAETAAGEAAPFLAADTLDFGGALGAAGDFASLGGAGGEFASLGGEFGSSLPESSSLASLSSDASGFNIPGETFVQPGDVV